MDYPRELAVDIAMRFLGKPYIWGGDDPIKGFDCSGFVIEVLKSVGVLSFHGDWTAQGLYNYFKNYRIEDGEKEGCLVFFQRDGRIIHVEMMIDKYLTIGASGGDSLTNTVEDAVRKNAYIKIRPLSARNLLVKKFVDPFANLERG